MRIHTRYISFSRVRDCILCLDYFYIVRYSGRKTVLRLRQSLMGEFNGTARHRYLIGRRFKIQQSIADLLVDTLAQVGLFCLALLQSGIGLFDIRADAASCQK